MIVTFSCNEAEARAREDEFYLTPSGRRQRRDAWAIFGFTAFLLPVVILYAFLLPIPSGVRALLILQCVVLCFSTFPTAFFRSYRQAMKLQVRVAVREEGLAVAEDKRPNHITKWSDVVGCEIDDLFVRLRIATQGKKRNGEATIYIPRRAFATDGEMYAFLALVDRYRGATNAQTAQTPPIAVPAANVGAWYQSRTGLDTGQETENAASLRRSDKY